MILQKVYMKNIFYYLLFTLLFSQSSYSIEFNSHQLLSDAPIHNFLYSEKGKELIVEFSSEHTTDFSNLEMINNLSPFEKDRYRDYTLKPLMKFLFGPLTKRGHGGVKTILKLDIDWAHATVKQDHVILPYFYKGIWLIDNDLLLENNVSFILPVPKTEKLLFTEHWKKCTDANPDHQTSSFYWYFWDPDRPGCDQTEDIEYVNTEIFFKEKSVLTEKTYPEYNRLIQTDSAGHKVFKMTFAFGYITDQSFPRPDIDFDGGVLEYRNFLNEIKNILYSDPNLKIDNIYLRDYRKTGLLKDIIIGKKLIFNKADIRYEIKIVTNAGIDQMELFAESFAHDHDSYFAWLGHSRVGSGFDAQRFKSLVESDPTYFTIAKDYQIIYWGGCNSYSYYVDPFFQMKAAIQPDIDPKGTKNLDIIANGLPSFFSLNAKNALIHLSALMNRDKPTSYQDLIHQMEAEANRAGIHVLAIVIGDEDNEKK